MSRVIVTLHAEEREALTRFALAELRTPRDQARYLIRQILISKGLLTAEVPIADDWQKSEAAISGGQDAKPK